MPSAETFEVRPSAEPAEVRPDALKRPAASYPWVWFDLDDTVWNFTDNSLEALAQLYEAERLNRWWPDVDAWRDNYHRHNTALWALYTPGKIDRDTLRRERFRRPLTDAGVDAATAAAIAGYLDSEYLRRLALLPATIEGAHETLAALRAAGCRIGILSNGFKDTQQQKLRSSGLDVLVDLVVLSDDINVNKPDRRIYDYARRRAAELYPETPCAPGDCLMVGDNADTDIRGALNAGWDAVLMSSVECGMSNGFRVIRRLCELRE